MSDTPWYATFFGEAYLRIYSPFLPAEKTAREVENMLNLLHLAPGSCILDLCCGQGRHALLLAQRGYQMTGQDLSTAFLQHAQSQADAQQIQVRWLANDMRNIPYENEFDAIINVFSSFGYLENEFEDQRVLQQVVKALKPGGYFLLETIHQVHVMRASTPHGIIHYKDGLIVLEERHIDLLTSRNEIHISMLYPDGQRSQYHQSMRIYTLTELVRMLTEAGLHVQAYYGGLDQSPFTIDSRLVIVSQKDA